MSGWNLQTYAEEFRRVKLLGQWAVASNDAIPDTLILRLLNRAFAEIQKELRIVRARDTSLDFASGTASYSLPFFLVGDSIRDIFIKSSGGTLDTDPLERVDYAKFQTLHNLASMDTGTPVRWCLDRTSPRTILFGPAPNYTLADAVVINTIAATEPLFRVHRGITIASSGSFPSSTKIRLSAELTSGSQISVGDELGWASLTQIDETAIDDYGIANWYPIESFATVDTKTEVVLGNLGGLTTATIGAVASAPVIIAQVPLAERLLPGVLQMAPVHLALSYYFLGVSAVASSSYKDLAMQTLGSITLEDLGTIDLRPVCGKYALVD